MRSLLLAAAMSTAALAGATAVADPLDDAIKARRGYFTLLGANVGPLAAMAKGEMDYSAETAELHASNLLAMATYNPVPHFPAGSSNDDKTGDTRALPVIWSDLEGFLEKYNDMTQAIADLQSPAVAGRAELGQALGKVGGTCKACHDDYRAKDF
jgi:cytochrome c556